MSRDKSFDIISGIMILWMIVCHSFQWGNLTNSIIYNVLLKSLYFFMPWFYFKTGFLNKNNRSFTVVFKKGVDQLIIPMVIWTTVGYFLTIPELLEANKPLWKVIFAPIYMLLKNGETIGNSPLWFLLSLFIVKLVLKLISNFNNINKIILLVFLMILSWLLQKYNIQIVLGLHNLPLGLFFCLLGVLCNELEIIPRISKIKLLLTIPLILMSFYFASFVDLHDNKLKYGNYFIYILNSALAINLFLVFFKTINLSFLSWVGEKSIIYLIFHWPIFYIVKRFFEFLNSSIEMHLYVFTLNLVAILISTIVALFISNKYLGLQLTMVSNYKAVFRNKLE